MTDSSQPIAGWYPDPENPAAERWWDGTAWTDHRRASTVAPIAPPPPAPSAPDPNAPAYGAPAYPAYGAPAYPAYAPAYVPAAPRNSLAVVGLVLALGGLVVSFGGLTSLAGGVISTVALVRASRMRAQGLAGHRFGMALAGTICGYVLFVFVLGATILGLLAFANLPQDYSSYTGTLS